MPHGTPSRASRTEDPEESVTRNGRVADHGRSSARRVEHGGVGDCTLRRSDARTAWAVSSMLFLTNGRTRCWSSVRSLPSGSSITFLTGAVADWVAPKAALPRTEGADPGHFWSGQSAELVGHLVRALADLVRIVAGGLAAGGTYASSLRRPFSSVNLTGVLLLRLNVSSFSRSCGVPCCVMIFTWALFPSGLPQTRSTSTAYSPLNASAAWDVSLFSSASVSPIRMPPPTDCRFRAAQTRPKVRLPSGRGPHRPGKPS